MGGETEELGLVQQGGFKCTLTAAFQYLWGEGASLFTELHFGKHQEKLINCNKRVSDLVSGETFSPMNNNMSQEAQEWCGVSILGDFHIVQSSGFDPRIAALDLAWNQE